MIYRVLGKFPARFLGNAHNRQEHDRRNQKWEGGPLCSGLKVGHTVGYVGLLSNLSMRCTIPQQSLKGLPIADLRKLGSGNRVVLIPNRNRK